MSGQVLQPRSKHKKDNIPDEYTNLAYSPIIQATASNCSLLRIPEERYLTNPQWESLVH